MPLNNLPKPAPAALLGLALILSCFAFAGCGLNPGPAPPAYTLRPPLEGIAPGDHLMSSKIQLGINQPMADEALSNNRVAILIDNREFRYWQNATWTNQVPEMILNWMIAAFEADGRIFVSADDANGFLADYRLASYIREFNVIAEADGTYSVAFALSARLIDLRNGKVTDVFNKRYQQPAASADLPAIMNAFDAVVGKELSELADWAIANLTVE